MYICDLGSDTVWIADRNVDGMEVVGKMESERGDTPRHCLLSPNGQSHLRLITASQVLINREIPLCEFGTTIPAPHILDLDP